MTSYGNRTITPAGKIGVALCAALLAVGGAWAASAVDETKPAAPDGEVEISLISGGLNVVGWDRAEIQVTGDLGSGDPKFTFEVDGKQARIEVDPREDSYGDGPDLEVRVPRGSSLEIAGISVDISVSQVAGATEIETVSGPVEVRQAPAELEIEGVSGTVEVTGDTPIESLEVELVSGTVTVDVPLSASARVEMESVSGDLAISLPASLSAEIDVETFSGSIESEFGGKARKTSQYTPARELSTRVGAGDARIDIQSFSGTVKLLKK
jgi:hypothetical protein